MSAFGTAFGAAAAPVPSHNPNKDFEVTSPPSDGVSSLAFSPVANLLVAGSWDNQVRCWDVQPNGTSLPKAATQHDQPVLCTAWSADGTTVFSGEEKLERRLKRLFFCFFVFFSSFGETSIDFRRQEEEKRSSLSSFLSPTAFHEARADVEDYAL